MKLKFFDAASNCIKPKIANRENELKEIADMLLITGALALAIGIVIPDDTEPYYYFNGPQLEKATVEEDTYSLTFTDGHESQVTKEELAQEDFTFFGYNHYSIDNHNCSVTPREDISLKSIALSAGTGTLIGGIFAKITDKRNKNKRNEKDKAKQKRKEMVKKRLLETDK